MISSDSLTSSSSSTCSLESSDHILHVLETFNEESAMEVIRRVVMEYGCVAFISMLIQRGVMWGSLENVVKKVALERRLFQVDIERYMTSERQPYFPYPADSYLDYQWVNNFSKTKSNKDAVNLAHDFTKTSEKVAQIIILEKNLPDFKKTIKPQDIGGKAGGVKYIVSGILFKFAEDTLIEPDLWLYGGSTKDSTSASKGLDNELKALRAMYECREELSLSINIPLMCTTKFLGFSVCSISLLPITSNTLCYGTSDAGLTIFDGEGHSSLLADIEKIADYFHFAPHPVADSNRDIKTLSLASDVEIHYNHGQYFMLDFGRFLPPNDSSSPLVNLFRAEYCKKIQNQISCDAFLGFGRINSEHYNSQVLSHISRLDNLISRVANTLTIPVFNGEYIKKELHSQGVNIRFLGNIRRIMLRSLDESKKASKLSRHLTSKKKSKGKKKKNEIPVDNTQIQLHQSQEYVLMEIILRSIKTLFHSKLYIEKEKHYVPVEDLYRKIVVDLYKTLLDEDDPIWKNERPLKYIIQNKFKGSLQDFEIDESYNILNSISDRTILMELIPSYCSFEGGLFPYNTKILPKTKSSIPQLIENEIINELINDTRSHASNYLEELWRYRSHITFENHYIVPYLIKCINTFRGEKLQYYLEYIFSRSIELFTSRPYEINDLLRCVLSVPKMELTKENEKNIDLLVLHVFGNSDILIGYMSTVHMYIKERVNDKVLYNIMNHYTGTTLNLYGCDLITDNGFKHIEALDRLSEVKISYCSNLNNSIFQWLPYSVTSLDLTSFEQLDAHGLEYVYRLPQLRHLILRNCLKLDSKCFATISQCNTLETLDVYGCSDIDDGISECICELTNLRTLNIAGTSIVGGNIHLLNSLTELIDVGVGCELMSELHLSLPKVEVFFLSSRSGINSDDLDLFFEQGNFKTVQMRRSSISDKTLSRISEYQYLSSLDLIACENISDSGFEHFHKLKHLEELVLSNTDIGDLTLSYIKSCPLKKLDVSKTLVTDSGIENLKEVRSLRILSINKSKITDLSLKHLSNLHLKNLDVLQCPYITKKGKKYINHIKNLRI
eukprot:TRINITY_DN4536_c0_g1_i1.p1 TRINITY_DN4536_c0_g1~~TRINITY_DN4536_c0_g1_i1.p1  ORF type:complete len:1099 (-),score=176.90 TRINITY_DN4536_c0_g1_i1:6-3206(-)